MSSNCSDAVLRLPRTDIGSRAAIVSSSASLASAMEDGVSIGVFVRIPDNSQETTNTTTTVTIRILDFVKTRPRYSPRDGRY